MKKGQWKIYAAWILLAEAVGALSGWLSRTGMEVFSATAVQPPLSPPGFLFPVVWTVLYGLMGFGAGWVWLAEPSPERNRGLNLFIAQLVINFFWSLIFFNLGAYGFALVWLVLLWILATAMAVAFARVSPAAGWLQVPYLLWLTFAAYLNAGVWLLNR